jgi:hypothetical protein
MVNTRNSQCNGQPNNNNNNNNSNNNVNLEQLIATSKLCYRPSTIYNPMSKLTSKKHLHLHHHTSLIWRSSCELAPPPSHKPRTPWRLKIGLRELRRSL